MGVDSGIQWTDNTHNFWQGCIKVSPGCKYCYAERLFARFGKDFSNVTRIKNFNAPLSWKEPKKVFTCSTSDFFIEQADQWRAEAWEIIRNTPHLTYQILTKRPERIKECLPADWGNGWANVWLGVTVENNKTGNERIPILCQVPAVVRFLSCEPLLGPVNIGLLGTVPAGWGYSGYKLICQLLHWVIIGGESGYGEYAEDPNVKYRFRKCQLDWMHALVNECKDAGVACFVKQMGTDLAKEYTMGDSHGGNINEFPEHLQVREFPNVQFL